MKRTMTLSRWAVLAATLILTPGCDDDADSPETPEATDAGADAGADAAPADAAFIDPTAPVCPEPEALPFTVEASGFDDADLDEALAALPDYKHENMDLYGTPDMAMTVSGRMAKGRGLSKTPIEQEWVSLWTWNAAGLWDTLGRVKTDDAGRYAVELDGDARFGVGEHDVYAVLEGDQTCTSHGAFIWPEGTQVIVTDIDGTLTSGDAELFAQIADPSHDPARYEGAEALVNAWAAKGYKVVYLTARPHDFRVVTRRWLDEHDFPYGPVITAEQLVFEETARAYKEAAVSQLSAEFGWEIVAAYGNAQSDIGGYEGADVPKEITFIIGEDGGADDTVAILNESWLAHIAEYVEAQPDSTNTFETVPFER